MLKLTTPGTSGALDPKGRQEGSWDGGQLRGTRRPGTQSVPHDLAIHTHPHTRPIEPYADSPQRAHKYAATHWALRTHPPFARSSSFSAARRDPRKRIVRRGGRLAPLTAAAERASNEPQGLESHSPPKPSMTNQPSLQSSGLPGAHCAHPPGAGAGEQTPQHREPRGARGKLRDNWVRRSLFPTSASARPGLGALAQPAPHPLGRALLAAPAAQSRAGDQLHAPWPPSSGSAAAAARCWSRSSSNSSASGRSTPRPGRPMAGPGLRPPRPVHPVPLPPPRFNPPSPCRGSAAAAAARPGSTAAFQAGSVTLGGWAGSGWARAPSRCRLRPVLLSLLPPLPPPSRPWSTPPSPGSW